MRQSRKEDDQLEENKDDQNPLDELFDAISVGSLDMVGQIIDSNQGIINQCKESENRAEALTPLTKAVLIGNSPIVEELLKRGADVNLHDKTYTGRSPLFIAVDSANIEIARLLLSNGASMKKASTTMDIEDLATVALGQVAPGGEKNEDFENIANFLHNLKSLHDSCMIAIQNIGNEDGLVKIVSFFQSLIDGDADVSSLLNMTLDPDSPTLKSRLKELINPIEEAVKPKIVAEILTHTPLQEVLANLSADNLFSRDEISGKDFLKYVSEVLQYRDPAQSIAPANASQLAGASRAASK